MRNRLIYKILRSCIAETLIQAGYEKSSEKAVAILTDILSFYIETIFKEINIFMGRMCYAELIDELGDKTEDPAHEVVGEPKEVEDVLLGFILQTFVGSTESYNFNELIAFLNAQISIKNYLQEKISSKDNESLLHMLRVLPRNINLKNINREYKNNLTEIKVFEYQNFNKTCDSGLSIDEFTNNFIQRKMKEGVKVDRIIKMEDNCFLKNLVVNIPAKRNPVIKEEEYNKVLNKRRENLSCVGRYNSLYESEILCDLLCFQKYYVDKEGKHK